MLDSLYVESQQARMISYPIEKLSLLIQRASMNKMSDALKSRIANHQLMDKIMTHLARA